MLLAILALSFLLFLWGLSCLECVHLLQQIELVLADHLNQTIFRAKMFFVLIHCSSQLKPSFLDAIKLGNLAVFGLWGRRCICCAGLTYTLLLFSIYWKLLSKEVTLFKFAKLNLRRLIRHADCLSTDFAQKWRLKTEWCIIFFLHYQIINYNSKSSKEGFWGFGVLGLIVEYCYYEFALRWS